MTPLTRRQWDKQNPGKIKSSLAPYAVEVRKIAAEKNVPLVDLQARSIELCEQLGPEKCLELANKPGDATHFGEKGARAMAELVMSKLPGVVPELAPLLKGK